MGRVDSAGLARLAAAARPRHPVARPPSCRGLGGGFRQGPGPRPEERLAPGRGAGGESKKQDYVVQGYIYMYEYIFPCFDIGALEAPFVHCSLDFALLSCQIFPQCSYLLPPIGSITYVHTHTPPQVQEPSINVSGQAVPRIAQVQIEGALQGDKNEPMAELWVPLDAELACQVNGGWCGVV